MKKAIKPFKIGQFVRLRYLTENSKITPSLGILIDMKDNNLTIVFLDPTKKEYQYTPCKYKKVLRTYTLEDTKDIIQITPFDGSMCQKEYLKWVQVILLLEHKNPSFDEHYPIPKQMADTFAYRLRHGKKTAKDYGISTTLIDYHAAGYALFDDVEIKAVEEFNYFAKAVSDNHDITETTLYE